MFWNKKPVQQEEVAPVKRKAPKNLAQELAPLHEVGRFAIEQKNKLQSEEAVTIKGIETIEDSFDLVQQKYGNIIGSVDNF